MEEIRERMAEIEDPRHPNYVKYSLADILIVIMCGVLCGLDTLEDLVVYAKSKADFLKKELGGKVTMNSIFSKASLFMITFALILIVCPLNAQAAENTTEFMGGDGTAENPYLISSKTHLNNIRHYLDAHFEIITDIAFSDADFQESGNFYNNGEGWIPLGSEETPFTGTLNGGNYTVSKIQCNSTTMGGRIRCYMQRDD